MHLRSCTSVHIVYTHSPYTCTHKAQCTSTHMDEYSLVEANGVLPAETVSAVQLAFICFCEKSLNASRISFPSIPNGWEEKPRSPQNDFRTAGVCNFGESWSKASFSCWPLVGFRAVNGYNLPGLRFIALSVKEDVIYLTGGTVFAPKKMFYLLWITFRLKESCWDERLSKILNIRFASPKIR